MRERDRLEHESYFVSLDPPTRAEREAAAAHRLVAERQWLRARLARVEDRLRGLGLV